MEGLGRHLEFNRLTTVKSLRLHGLKSGKLLKEFQGHTSCINEAIFSHNCQFAISASADGTVKVNLHLICIPCPMDHYMPLFSSGALMLILSFSGLEREYG